MLPFKQIHKLPGLQAVEQAAVHTLAAPGQSDTSSSASSDSVDAWAGLLGTLGTGMVPPSDATWEGLDKGTLPAGELSTRQLSNLLTSYGNLRCAVCAVLCQALLCCAQCCVVECATDAWRAPTTAGPCRGPRLLSRAWSGPTL